MAATPWLVGLVAIATVAAGAPDTGEDARNSDQCLGHEELMAAFTKAHFDFAVKVFKASVVHECKTKNRKVPHFVYAMNNIWISLAAIAEGSIGETRKQLFHTLNLPTEECQRKAFYQIALSREQPNVDVRIDSHRVLAVDECLHIDDGWKKTISTHRGLQVAPFPLKSNPAKATRDMRRLTNGCLDKVSLKGYSAVLNSWDYEGLWTTAFPDAVVEKEPFHDEDGTQTGYVDVMRTKLYVRMAYVKSLSIKVLELPVGHNGRYRMYISMSLNGKTLSEIAASKTSDSLPEALEALRQSRIPVEVALPRFTIDTELNERAILESIGVKALWRNASETCNISKPSAFPSGYVQRASASFATAGVQAEQEAPEEAELHSECDPRTGLHPLVGADFIANRPFAFELFDAETYTMLMAGVYSAPTYGF